jgi:hypothetical protein
MTETPTSRTKVTQDVYEGVTEVRRPTLVGILWASGAVRVEVLKADDGTYTITATFPVPDTSPA